METVEELATRLLKEIDSARARNRRSKPARRPGCRKQASAARRKRAGMAWLGLGARLLLVGGAVAFWWWTRRQRRLAEEMEQAYLRGPSGPYDYTHPASPQPAAPVSGPAPAVKEAEPCGEMQAGEASAGAQASGRAAVQTATRAEPTPGAAERMASGEGAPGGIAAAFPAKPAAAPASAEPAANEEHATPNPTVLAPAGEVSPEVAPLVSAEVEASPAAVDDLKLIEGIGPRIAAVLGEQGITTFRQLSETPVERLRDILRSYPNLRLADPATWPEQAALAARGDWPALTALQDSLKGGRRDNS